MDLDLWDHVGKDLKMDLDLWDCVGRYLKI